MATAITLKTLLRHHYQETSKEQNEQISSALANNWLLQEEQQLMQETLNSLDSLKESPSAKSIDAILSYSRMTPVDA
jgi:hypothetical protein